MTENLQFIYEKEYWFVSAFVNSNKIDLKEKVNQIKKLAEEKIPLISEQDLGKIKWNKEWVKSVIELAKNISILSVEWVTYLDGLPYHEENTNRAYNKLGYFQFEVEYYKNDLENKKKVKPHHIQQIPVYFLELIKRFSDLKINDYVNIDVESPIYVFAISAKTEPQEIEWNEDNIKKYKKVIGNWSEIYSGSWPDYSDKLYNSRIEGNLSNRLSELHFLKRNSGFIYMKEENYKTQFPYMFQFVLTPTAQIRALLFALMSINQSLDILFTRQSREESMDIEIIEAKLKDLKELRGRLQTQMSVVYNELDYNRRQHYTAVLKHLIEEFNLGAKGIIDRVNKKFDTIYESMNQLYQKREQENSEQTEQNLNRLNLLFGLGILGDGAGLLISLIDGISSADISSSLINGVSFFIILGVGLYILYMIMKSKLITSKSKVSEAVDAVIIDDKGNAVMIIRKDPPFKGELALPGGFIEEGEKPEEAVIREAKEETNLDIQIIQKVGIYDKPERDPRGRVISHAFLCKCISNPSELRGKDDAIDARWFSCEQLSTLDLAFDHADILADALKCIGK